MSPSNVKRRRFLEGTDKFWVAHTLVFNVRATRGVSPWTCKYGGVSDRHYSSFLIVFAQRRG